jgi:hypothetical protein
MNDPTMTEQTELADHDWQIVISSALLFVAEAPMAHVILLSHFRSEPEDFAMIAQTRTKYWVNREIECRKWLIGWLYEEGMGENVQCGWILQDISSWPTSD